MGGAFHQQLYNIVFIWVDIGLSIAQQRGLLPTDVGPGMSRSTYCLKIYCTITLFSTTLSIVNLGFFLNISLFSKSSHHGGCPDSDVRCHLEAQCPSWPIPSASVAAINALHVMVGADHA